jgi:hypothetical protein
MFRVLAVSPGLMLAFGAVSAHSTFERASIYLERNASDEDVEVCFLVTANEEGLKALRVIAPDGRTIIDFKVSDSSWGYVTSTWKHSNRRSIMAGLRRMQRRKARPSPAHRESDETSRRRGRKLYWPAVKDVPSYVVTLEDNDDVRTLKATLPGRWTLFNIHEGLMVHGTEFKAGRQCCTAGRQLHLREGEVWHCKEIAAGCPARGVTWP